MKNCLDVHSINADKLMNNHTIECDDRDGDDDDEGGDGGEGGEGSEGGDGGENESSF